MHIRAQINHARRHATTNHLQLKLLGYQQIGHGAFARVFVHPDAPDVVIKVGNIKSRHKSFDSLRDAFPDYARLCQRSRSKFYPRIYDLQEEDGGGYYAIMRRYQEQQQRATIKTISHTASTLRYTDRFPATDLRRFGRALRPLADLFQFDIHNGNIMQNALGTPILTDPVVYDH